jgi:hypothetical protein
MNSANTRYGQSAALYGDSMFVYGGTSERAIIMEDLLEFKFGNDCTKIFFLVIRYPKLFLWLQKNSKIIQLEFILFRNSKLASYFWRGN